jgi:ribosome-associated protein
VEKRAYYGLERLRKSATTLSIADLNAQLASQIQATITAKRPKKPVAKKKAPKKVVHARAVVRKKAAKKALASKAAKARKPAKKKSTKKSPRR